MGERLLRTPPTKRSVPFAGQLLCIGECSAEGHQWTDASIVTDYVENLYGPGLAAIHTFNTMHLFTPDRFYLGQRLTHGKSQNIREACLCNFGPDQTWSSIYRDFLNHKKLEFKNKTTIQPVEPILSQNFLPPTIILLQMYKGR